VSFAETPSVVSEAFLEPIDRIDSWGHVRGEGESVEQRILEVRGKSVMESR
jgi:hypothetical protein